MSPASARPSPDRNPPEALILDRAMCPEITAGIPNNGPKIQSTRPQIPKTRLTVARPQGCWGTFDPMGTGLIVACAQPPESPARRQARMPCTTSPNTEEHTSEL